MLRYLLAPGNLFTASALFCGLYSILLSAGADVADPDAFRKAAVAIIFAGFFDALDGKVARLTKTSSAFGEQFDSLSDVIAFGVAPAVLMYRWCLEDAFGTIGLFLSFSFLLAAALRLARFNVSSASVPSGWSEGLASTAAGGTVASLVLAHHHYIGDAVQRQLDVALLTGILAYLMVSNVRFRTLKSLSRNPSTLMLVLASLLVTGAIAIYYGLAAFLVAGASMYIGLGLTEELIFFRRRRREDFPFLGSFDDDDESELEANEEEFLREDI